MRGTPSRKTTSASFPIARRICRQANAEPIASPSGLACEVSTNRLRCSMCLRTSFNIETVVGRQSSVVSLIEFNDDQRPTTDSLLLPLFRPAQQFVNPGAVFIRAIEVKVQFRRTAKVQVFRHLATDESDRLGQALQRTVGLGVIAIKGDENLRRARILRQYHAGDADQPDARAAQFALHDGFDFLPQGLTQALSMVFRAALLHSHLLSKTNENIRKSAVSGTAGLSRCGSSPGERSLPFMEPGACGRPAGQPDWTQGITRTKMLGVQ